MIKKIKQIIFLLLIIPASFIVGSGQVIGSTNVTISIIGSGKPGLPDFGPDNDDENNPGNNQNGPTYGSQCDRVSCNVNHSYFVEQNINISIKRQDGTIVQEDLFSPDFSEEFLAGTSVMLRVYETQKFTTTASYTVSAKRQRWLCIYYDQYQVNYCAGPVNANGTCPSGSQSTYTAEKVIAAREEDCSCSGSADRVEHVWMGWRDVTTEYVASCSAKATPAVINLTPSYIASYKDSNDINAEPSSDKYYTAETVKGNDCDKPVKGKKTGVTGPNGYSSANTLSGSCSVSYDRIGKTCINVKNAKVRYIKENEKCEEPDEYTITPDKDGYWKYFIPLNANSDEDFIFSLNSNTEQKALSDICQALIEKYDNYSRWITDSNGNSFIGKNISKNQAKKMVSNGCYFKTTAVIPVKQRFYNELENGKNFKGFNFYYKPIDIENPFPNGLTNTSIWYDWNESKVKDPDISKSYQEVTYIGFTSGNENLIRQYNKMQENEYTNWQKMNVNGQSSYINKNENIIDRRVDKDSFYALGCGPINSTSDVNNVFYQKECDIS